MEVTEIVVVEEHVGFLEVFYLFVVFSYLVVSFLPYVLVCVFIRLIWFALHSRAVRTFHQDCFP